MRSISRLILVAFLSITILVQCGKQLSPEEMMTDFFQKKDVTILVTDSGLGGLSITADVASRLPKSGVFQKVRLVFFNSLFTNDGGYNSLKEESEKLRIFDVALKAMQKKYKPDLLLIGCNTLSVLYPKTRFAKKPAFPVIEIVQTGVDSILEEFDKNPHSDVIIFATRTTIGSEAHKRSLVDKGIEENQIIGQVCHRLAGFIERGIDSPETIELIRQFIEEAIHKRTNNESTLFASLNCTNYGYSIDQFKEIFSEIGFPSIEVIDPNPRMADVLFQEPYTGRFSDTSMSIEVVSKVEISKQKQDSLGSFLEQVSPDTAKALKEYSYSPNLFDPGRIKE